MAKVVRSELGEAVLAQYPELKTYEIEGRQILFRDGSGRVVKVKSLVTLPEKVKQEFADETNINKIMEKYYKGEAIRHLNHRPGEYLNNVGAKDLRESLDVMVKAQESFLELPSKVRNRFNNDPVQVIEFLEDPANRAEAELLGLVEKKVENGNSAATAAPPPASKSPS